MKGKRTVKVFVALIFVFLFSAANIVSADEYSVPDTLTIICRKEGIVLSDMSWKIYKVAEITSRDNFEVVDEFKKYPVSLTDHSVSSLKTAASQFETYTITDNIEPLKSGKTDSKGELQFSNLDFGLYLITGSSIVIDEMAYVPVPSLVQLTDEYYTETKWTYDLTSIPKMRVLAASTYKTSYSVEKKWINDNDTLRPKNITAVLCRNGVSYASAVLNQKNNWKYTWDNLPQNAEWSVKEQSVPSDYSVTYDVGENSVTIINTYNEKTSTTSPDTSESGTQNTTYISNISGTNVNINHNYINAGNNNSSGSIKLPQTGMMLWPVPVLGISGIIIFIVGWILYKRSKNER